MSRPGFSTVTPYIAIRDAAKAIDYYKAAFGAEETLRQEDEQGRIRHAEIRIGNSTLMFAEALTDEFSYMRGVQDLGGSPVQLFLYVDDPDGWAKRMQAAGATEIMPMEEKPYARIGGYQDPYGFIWWIARHNEGAGEPD
jgi:PhnB protein